MGKQHGAWPRPTVLALRYDDHEVDIVLAWLLHVVDLRSRIAFLVWGGCGITFWERDVRPLIERMIIGKEKTEPEILLPTQPGK